MWLSRMWESWDCVFRNSCWDCGFCLRSGTCHRAFQLNSLWVWIETLVRLLPTGKGWCRDNDSLEPTNVYDETTGDIGFRLHFNHLIRKRKSFAGAELTYRLRSPTRVNLPAWLYELYNSDEWQQQLESSLKERGIANTGNKQDYFARPTILKIWATRELFWDAICRVWGTHSGRRGY